MPATVLFSMDNINVKLRAAVGFWLSAFSWEKETVFQTFFASSKYKSPASKSYRAFFFSNEEKITSLILLLKPQYWKVFFKNNPDFTSGVFFLQSLVVHTTLHILHRISVRNDILEFFQHFVLVGQYTFECFFHGHECSFFHHIRNDLPDLVFHKLHIFHYQ